MKRKKVIKTDNLPSKLPINQTLLSLLFLDYWNAPQWLCGGIGFLLLMIWIVAIYGIVTEKQVDLF